MAVAPVPVPGCGIQPPKGQILKQGHLVFVFLKRQGVQVVLMA